MPFFSIITAVFNRRDTVGHALDSLAAQSCGDWEHLVQDGLSTDGTADLLRARAQSEPRMRLVSEPDHSIYDALNRALERASGDVVGLLHSDDFYAYPDVLADVQQRFMESGCDAVYGDLDYVSSSNPDRIVRRWRTGSFNPMKLRRGWMPPHPSLFVRRDVFRHWGDYNTKYRIAADYDVVLRLFGKASISSAYLPEVVMKMRAGGVSNRSFGQILRKSLEDLDALRTNQVGGFRALALKNLRKFDQFLRTD